MADPYHKMKKIAARKLKKGKGTTGVHSRANDPEPLRQKAPKVTSLL